MKRLGFFLAGLMMITFINAQTAVDTLSAPAIDTLENYEQTPEKTREQALLSRLNPEQLFQLEQRRIEQEQFEDMPLPAWAIVLICIAPFLMVVLIVFFSSKARKEREKARYDLYLKSIEAGQPLPEKIFETPERKGSNLQKGAIWLAVGLGVFIFGTFKGDNTLMGLGAIPAFVGAAFLLVYFIEKKNNNDSPAVNE